MKISLRMIELAKRAYRMLHEHRFISFFIVGSSGVALNLVVTWFFTTFVFGLAHYFTAFLIGMAANMAYNFTLYTIAIFKTKTGHLRRAVIFVLYTVCMATLQAAVVKTIAPLVGIHLYLFVIAGTILFFSVINFLVFKISIFKQDTPPLV